jgi:hypothetical protein
MKTKGEVVVYLHRSWPWHHGREWSASRPSGFMPGERAPSTHWVRCWVDHRPVWMLCRKIFCPCRELNPAHAARSPLLYQVSYSGPNYYTRLHTNLSSAGQFLYQRFPNLIWPPPPSFHKNLMSPPFFYWHTCNPLHSYLYYCLWSTNPYLVPYQNWKENENF